MNKIVLWLSQRRKALLAAAVPALPLVAHFLHQGPVMSDDAAWWLFIVGESAAVGVHAVSNDGEVAAAPEVTATPPAASGLNLPVA